METQRKKNNNFLNQFNSLTCRNGAFGSSSTLSRVKQLKQKKMTAKDIDISKEINANNLLTSIRKKYTKKREGINLEMPQNSGKFSYSNKFIEKQRKESKEGVGKKNYQSYLDKCRMVTENYDQLKKEIIQKIRIKKTNNNINRFRCKTENERIINKQQNGLWSIEKENCSNMNKTQMKVQLSNMSTHQRLIQYEGRKVCQRYSELSVADFMEEDCKVSDIVSKRFNSYRKEWKKEEDYIGQSGDSKKTCKEQYSTQQIKEQQEKSKQIFDH